jgi:hypothetical protein
MPETQQITFSHREIVEMLIKNQNIHDGYWGIIIEFGLGAGALPAPPNGNPVPSAIVQISKIGIQRSDKPNPQTVDASTVNPRP